MHLQMAWRNIWRHPRRTLTILTAVVVGVWSMIFMAAISRGMGEAMLDNALDTLTNHIQIQTPEYRNDPVVDHHLPDTGHMVSMLQDLIPPGAAWTERVQVFGVVSNARHSLGVTLVGIDPEREPGMSFYGDLLAQGSGLEAGDELGIVVGEALAEQFDTAPERKLVLMSQHMDGSMASLAFRIRGVYRAEMEATEKQYVFINIDTARDMLGLGQEATNIAIQLPRRQDMDSLLPDLRQELPADVIAYGWPDLLPMLSNYLKIFDSFLYLWYAVTFVAMAFGITNTTLMAVLERIREYGLLKALGMRPGRIVRSVLLESFLLLTMGVLLGDLLGLIFTWSLSSGIDLSAFSQGSEFLGMGRIVYPLATPKDIMVANAMVLILGLLVSLYPALKAGRITPVEAMAHT